MSLDTAVRDRVAAETGSRPEGPIRMLTHLRYFGVGFNPVTFYYCFDAEDRRVEHIVAEITNTPWNERHAYVLPDVGPSRVLRYRLGKEFHVSPFMPMDLAYDWRFTHAGRAPVGAHGGLCRTTARSSTRRSRSSVARSAAPRSQPRCSPFRS